jgi:hypothetical protein
MYFALLHGSIKFISITFHVISPSIPTCIMQRTFSQQTNRRTSTQKYYVVERYGVGKRYENLRENLQFIFFLNITTTNV